MIRVYKQHDIKVGKKKVKVWKVAFTPKKGTGDFPQDGEWSQCTKYVQKDGGLDTSTNKLAENAHTQCPNCKEIFDHTKEEANCFITVRRLI